MALSRLDMNAEMLVGHIENIEEYDSRSAKKINESVKRISNLAESLGDFDLTEKQSAKINGIIGMINEAVERKRKSVGRGAPKLKLLSAQVSPTRSKKSGGGGDESTKKKAEIAEKKENYDLDIARLEATTWSVDISTRVHDELKNDAKKLDEKVPGAVERPEAVERGKRMEESTLEQENKRFSDAVDAVANSFAEKAQKSDNPAEIESEEVRLNKRILQITRRVNAIYDSAVRSAAERGESIVNDEYVSAMITDMNKMTNEVSELARPSIPGEEEYLATREAEEPGPIAH